MINLATVPSVPPLACSGNCKGCNKVHIKIVGHRDEHSKQLRAHVEEALSSFPLEHKIIEISEPNAIALTGVSATPALILEGQIMAEGRVPAAAEVVELLRNRYLFQSKLHRLRRIGVAVDVRAKSESVLLFAWHIAQQVNASLEVVYVMDSIFTGRGGSEPGFLSNYPQTMQLELDAFIRDTLLKKGVDYAAQTPGMPGDQPRSISSRVIYGFPEEALQEYSQQIDFLVLGTAGQGSVRKKIFGSVSVQVSKMAECAVLLVPPGAVFEGFKKVVYSSNFESLDTLRIQQALSFVQHFNGQVHFVHVGPAGEKGDVLEQQLFETSYREAQGRAPFLYSKLMSEDVLGALYEHAFYKGTELFVFVTHRRNMWENILHRSLTREAALSSDLPVLVIHGDNDMLHKHHNK